jgi:pantetheine-phosphate adenylyltransferase
MNALYPGSFDPITLGHLDIIEAAAPLFETLIVGIFANGTKTPEFTVEEREEMIAASVAHLRNVHFHVAHPMAVAVTQAHFNLGADVLIRGLRIVSDFESELQMAFFNRDLNSAVQTVFVPCRQEHVHISSSVVREVMRLGGDPGRWVPEGALPIIRKHIEEKKV